jgi:hypothetical protein
MSGVLKQDYGFPSLLKYKKEGGISELTRIVWIPVDRLLLRIVWILRLFRSLESSRIVWILEIGKSEDRVDPR